jgi:hypothetical protein
MHIVKPSMVNLHFVRAKSRPKTDLTVLLCYKAESLTKNFQFILRINLRNGFDPDRNFDTKVE